MNTQTGRSQLFLITVLTIAGLIGGFIAGRQSLSPHAGHSPSAGTGLESRSSSEGPSGEVISSQNEAEKADTEEKVQWWTCSMHPQIKLPSGDMKCPICFMDLIPLEESSPGEESVPEITLSERARVLAEIETAPVERREVTKTLRLVGKIQPDETKLAMITARVPGRLERLFVDYTGMKVRKGDHLVEIYSPELFSAQQELLQWVQTRSETKDVESSLAQHGGSSLIEASKQKLVRWGLTPEQVEEVIGSGVPKDTVTLFSPTAGIVLRREGTLGMYVEEGTTIYAIADLSNVWLLLDAYESDMEWLHYGQKVGFETEAYPGEHFEGTLSFISPILDDRSRTVKLRVNVPNPDDKLRPGMFARATIQAVPVEGGRVMAPELSGKWICPMHPEIVEDLFRYCPVCGMKLETAESLGFTTAATPETLPLVIPETAPLVTGKRAVVYVEEKREDGLFYVGREVELGPHADGYYVVAAGLAEGEHVVVKGNFKIDSALQIVAKPSMMTLPPGETIAPSVERDEAKYEPVTISDDAAGKIRPILETYLKVQKSLSEDSFDSANTAAVDLEKALTSFQVPDLPEEAKPHWEKHFGSLKGDATEAARAKDIEILREKFEGLSVALDTLVRRFGNVLDVPLKHTFCPMAFNDKGAFWLQTDKMVANPYFGSEMLRCGVFRETYPPRTGSKEAAHD